MSKSYIEQLVGCFGFPVEENPSCVINNAAFEKLGIQWRYLTLEAPPEKLADCMKAIRAINMRGCNFTIPHKVEVLNYLDELAPEVEIIGACNTVIHRDGKLIGNNTDGKGFLRSLTDDAKVDMNGKRMLFLGAGGAARAMTVESALRGASHITVAARTAAKGQVLVDLINEKTQAQSELLVWDGSISVPDGTDIVANATNVGMFPNVDDAPDINYSSISSSMLCCDAVMNPPDTAFLKNCRAQGAETLDGLGMLVYQAAIGIELWTGQSPDCEVMKQALLREYGLA